MNQQQPTAAFQRRVINNIYETDKMLLTLERNSVTKTFKPKVHSHRRYLREKEALTRLQNVPGTPSLLNADDQHHTLRMSRLPGTTATALSEKHAKTLLCIVKRMHQVGVARHSLPIRDIVVEGDTLGLVDFERSTLRRHAWRPDWWLAKKLDRYHAYRLIAKFQPQLLNHRQWLQLRLVDGLRGMLIFLHLLQ